MSLKQSAPTLPGRSGAASCSRVPRRRRSSPKECSAGSSPAIARLHKGSLPLARRKESSESLSSGEKDGRRMRRVTEIDKRLLDPNWSDSEDKADGVVDSGGSLRSSNEDNLSVEEDRSKLLKKVEQTRERLKQETLRREADVEEYLKLTQQMPLTSDNPQLARIRQVFDKKNRTSSKTMDSLQRKLENYTQRLNQLNESPDSRRADRNVLTNVGQGLKDMGANIGSVIAVPKDLASRLKHKFGSADNIPAVTGSNSDDLEVGVSLIRRDSPRTLPHFPRGAAKFYTDLSDERQRGYENGLDERRASGSPLRHQPENVDSSAVEQVLRELGIVRQRQEQYQIVLDELKNQIQREYTNFNGALHDEKFRYQRLEDQMNDTIELHQAEVQNLKQEIQSLTARLEYQHDQRIRDITDMLESTQNRMERLEQLQQQESEIAEGLTKRLALKGMNVLILVIQVVLIVLNVLNKLIQPLVQTTAQRVALGAAGLLLLAAYFFYGSLWR